MNRIILSASVVLILAACGAEPELADGRSVTVIRTEPTPPETLDPAALEISLTQASLDLRLDTVDQQTEVLARVVQPRESACVTLEATSRLVVAGEAMVLDEQGQGEWVNAAGAGVDLGSFVGTRAPTGGGWVRQCTAPWFSGAFAQQGNQALTIVAGERTWVMNEGVPHFELIRRGEHQVELAWRGAQLPDSYQVAFQRKGQLPGLALGGLDVIITRSPTSLSLLVTVPSSLQGLEGSILLDSELHASPGQGLEVSMHTVTHVAVE